MDVRLWPLTLLFLTLALIAAGCSSSSAPPAAGVAGGAGEVNAEYAALVQQSLSEVQQKTAAFEGLFQIGTADWELDQDTGLITFRSKSGAVATAPVQLAGTYNQADGTWLWAWENPSIDAKLAAHASQARQYGQQHNIAELTTAKLSIPEDKALELAAVTCKLGGNQGVYRGASEGTVLFITFGEPTLQQGEPIQAAPSGSPAETNPAAAPGQPAETGRPD